MMLPDAIHMPVDPSEVRIVLKKMPRLRYGPLHVSAMDSMLLQRRSRPWDIYSRLRWHSLDTVIHAPDWEPGECDG